MMSEAVAWFELMAMKQNREARDANFIASQEKEAVALAEALEHSGDTYEAWREYQQAAATFDGLADTTALQEATVTLAQEKAVHDGQKREKDEARQQAQVAGEIYSGLAALRGNAAGGGDESPQPSQPRGGVTPSVPQSDDPTRSDVFHHTEQQIVSLRDRAASEKNPDRVRVERRALMGVFITAAEFGDDCVSAKNFDLAKDYFQLAVDAKPDSLGALKELAKAQALSNDRKGSLKTLRRAKEQSKDNASFSDWLKDEPAFAKLQQDPQFRALRTNP
jgi:tetratricopeptide (TPR) repeat protein